MYSMGTCELTNPLRRHILLEVRGYSRLKFTKQNITISNLADFIKNEADFFFRLQQLGGVL